jgi:hypothetical protein
VDIEPTKRKRAKAAALPSYMRRERAAASIRACDARDGRKGAAVHLGQTPIGRPAPFLSSFHVNQVHKKMKRGESEVASSSGVMWPSTLIGLEAVLFRSRSSFILAFSPCRGQWRQRRRLLLLLTSTDAWAQS